MGSSTEWRDCECDVWIQLLASGLDALACWARNVSGACSLVASSFGYASRATRALCERSSFSTESIVLLATWSLRLSCFSARRVAHPGPLPPVGSGERQGWLQADATVLLACPSTFALATRLVDGGGGTAGLEIKIIAACSMMLWKVPGLPRLASSAEPFSTSGDAGLGRGDRSLGAVELGRGGQELLGW